MWAPRYRMFVILSQSKGGERSPEVNDRNAKGLSPFVFSQQPPLRKGRKGRSLARTVLRPQGPEPEPPACPPGGSTSPTGPGGSTLAVRLEFSFEVLLRLCCFEASFVFGHRMS